MFVCSVCGASFTGWMQKRQHAMQCSTSFSTVHNASNLGLDRTSVHSSEPIDTTMSTDLPVDETFDQNNESNRINNLFPDLTIPIIPAHENSTHSWRSDSAYVLRNPTSGPTKPTCRDHTSTISKNIRSHENALKWTNNNYCILSQLVNSLTLSQSDTDRLLRGVFLKSLLCALKLITSRIQIRCINSDLPMPTTCHQLKVEEDRVLAESKMHTFDLSSITQPVTTQGVLMIAPDQKLFCMTYDLWATIQDLLNDGDHAANAQFTYRPGAHDIISEMWTADWWKEQQDEVGQFEKILALILYVDETNVTFNGRNVHPVYISLGNLHVDFRLQFAW